MVGELPWEMELNPDPWGSGVISGRLKEESWNDAMEFCRLFFKRTGRNDVLPSEARWEFTCRAGTTTPLHFGAMIILDPANYDASNSFRGGDGGESRVHHRMWAAFPPTPGACTT
jgi:formylglycine-generating enzyme required for sulfatase activity